MGVGLGRLPDPGAVVIPSYPLCPAVGVGEIVDALARFLAAAGQRLGRAPVLVGHSAGGHLAAALLSDGGDGERVAAAVAISGVFDLVPLVDTRVNDRLGLDAVSARAVSPRWWPVPPEGAGTLLVAVGEHESAEFRRQAREMADHWAAGPQAGGLIEIPGANHFTIVDELARPGSELFSRVRALAGA